VAPIDSPPRSWSDTRFEPVQFIGRGTGGLVYRVLDRETGEEVALKTFAERDPESLYRLKQEFRACAGIRHRNLVQLYELRVNDDDCFFTMELVDGVDFIRHVRGEFASTAGQALVRFLRAAQQLAEGVAALHAAGRLHRDVKPPNALVDTTGRTVLLDFGFMMAFGGRVLAVERSDTIAGSLAYMAPEILWGEAPSPASDWYSVGVVFYEALSGHLPFDGTPATFVSRTGRQTPKPLGTEAPGRLRELIGALLSLKPDHRPGAEEIARVIGTCSAEQRAAVMPAPLADELPFVGRVAELAALHAAAAELSDGVSTVVQIRGPSGIGKSELVRQFLAQLECGDGVVALSGRCHPYEAVPYRAFDGLVDSLSRYLIGLPDSDAAEIAPRYTSALIRLFPVLGRVPGFGARQSEGHGGDAQEQRRRGFAALRELLARLGDRRRLVLWIDDVQWADVDSTALGRELFGGIDPPRALVLLTYRSDDREAAEAFASFDRGGTDRPSQTRLIELEPLGESDARALAERFAGGRLSDVSAAVREAAGSPFFVGQMVRHLISTPDAQAQGLSQVMEARLGHLGHHARNLLEVVAVAGRPIEPRLALTAASLLSASRREVITLQEERLLRLTAASGNAIEVYHDRIRESVLATLSSGALRERHRSLAHTLVREADPDPQALYRHFLGAGETAPAADWATEAAERADRALAFAEAEQLYGAAARLLDSDSERHWTLQERRANALVNAGRGAEAAPLFFATADRQSGAQRLDLQRRATEQLLQTGRMAEGTESLKGILREVGLAYPRSTIGAAVPTLLRLGMIALRGTRGLQRGEVDLTPRGHLRIESSRCAAKGLVMVDPFRGMYFAVRTLSLALRTRDPRRAVRELAEVGAALVPTGPPFAGWAGRMIDQARQMALEFDDPYLRGLTAITLAQKRMVEGRWRDMLELCDEGARILTEQCAGVSWEVALAHGAGERALEELGDVTELATRADQGLRRAESTGDMYRTVWALENLAVAWAAQSRFAEARAAIRLARRRWIPSGFHMQHLYMFRNEAYCDLGERSYERAWQQVEDVWPQVVQANLLRHALLKTDAHLLRARVALAYGLRASHRRAELLRIALSDAQVLERQRRVDTLAHAQTVRAAVAMQGGAVDQARRHLEDAALRFQSAEMGLMQGIARFRLGNLIGGSAGIAQARAAGTDLRRLGVVPDEIADVYAPGFPDTTH
jgi:hypothetical protein